MEAKERKAQLLDAGLKLARTHGYLNVSRLMVAKEVNCSASILPVYFKTMDVFRAAVITYACENEDVRVIAQALAMRDRQAIKAVKDDKLRWKIILFLFPGVK